MQCCPQAKPADLTQTRSGDKFSVSMCVNISERLFACQRACLHTAAASQFKKLTIEDHYSLRQLQILARGLRGRAARNTP